jgi:hypothetical protein
LGDKLVYNIALNIFVIVHKNFSHDTNRGNTLHCYRQCIEVVDSIFKEVDKLVERALFLEQNAKTI